MTKPLSKSRKVAVIRLRSLGDCVLTTPALHLLKTWRPDLEIGIAVEPRFRDIFAGNPDALLIDSVRDFRPGLVLNLHGGTRSAWTTATSGATHRAGFAHFSPSWIYNLKIPRAQEILGVERTVHTAEHVASAMFWLGVPHTDIPRARLFAQPERRASPYAILHPFASAPEKQWPRFNELACQLPLQPIFIGAADDDTTPFAEWPCERRSLSGSMSLIAGASLFIGNDSGPAHIAAAFGIPSVVLFGPSNEQIWGPWRTEAQVLKKLPLSDLRVAEVTDAIARLGVRV